MSKKRTIDIISSPTASKQARELSPSSANQRIDWKKCFICQEETSEKLQYSTSATSSDALNSYNELAERIHKFHTIAKMPVSMNIDLAGDMELGKSLYDTLQDLGHNFFSFV